MACFCTEMRSDRHRTIHPHQNIADGKGLVHREVAVLLVVEDSELDRVALTLALLGALLLLSKICSDGVLQILRNLGGGDSVLVALRIA